MSNEEVSRKTKRLTVGGEGFGPFVPGLGVTGGGGPPCLSAVLSFRAVSIRAFHGSEFRSRAGSGQGDLTRPLNFLENFLTRPLPTRDTSKYVEYLLARSDCTRELF